MSKFKEYLENQNKPKFDFAKRLENIKSIDVVYLNDSFNKKDWNASKEIKRTYEAKDWNKINFLKAKKIVVEFKTPIGITKSDIGNGYKQEVNKTRLRIK